MACSVVRQLSHAPIYRVPVLRRNFASSTRLHLRTTELQDLNLKSLRVNPHRLWETIHSTAKWTEPKKTANNDIKTAGLSRLTLSKEDKQARDWFVDTVKSLGCTSHVDQMGNIFAIRPGLKNDVPATFVGSHLDSQPSGGRFDGVLGVAAGVEMLRVLNDNWIETEGPVGVVNWTNEEGAKFPISMMGSGVWSGRVSAEDAWSTKSVTPGAVSTVKEDLERIGYLGDVACHHKSGIRLGAHFELHIEQGPKLEASRQAIGIVHGVQAYKWFTVTVTGRESHAGTTDFESRADALLFAAVIMQQFQSIAQRAKGLATVGMLSLSPGSVNTVPGQVRLSLDLRHPQDMELNAMEREIRKVCEEKSLSQVDEDGNPRQKPLSPLAKIDVAIQEDFSSRAVTFDAEAIKCIEESALTILGDEGQTQKMISGAGHDSVCTNMHCPTGMIFVPCKDGVSHNPSEWCEKDDCATGANVLLHTVLRMDRLRKETGDFD